MTQLNQYMVRTLAKHYLYTDTAQSIHGTLAKHYLYTDDTAQSMHGTLAKHYLYTDTAPSIHGTYISETVEAETDLTIRMWPIWLCQKFLI